MRRSVRRRDTRDGPAGLRRRTQQGRGARRERTSLPPGAETSYGYELVIRALGDLAPAGELPLKLRERRVDLGRHRAFLGLLPKDVRRELPQILHHRRGQRDDLHLALPLGLELVERQVVLRLVLGETLHLARHDGVVKDAAKIDRQRVVRLLVED